MAEQQYPPTNILYWNVFASSNESGEDERLLEKVDFHMSINSTEPLKAGSAAYRIENMIGSFP
jgi:hypothetical protein